VQLARGGAYGPEKPMGPSFRYHAGPGKPWGTDSLSLSDKLPDDWVLVTRDLFADFGEFTLTGLSLDPVDGAHALFDHMRLGRTLRDFEED
jgi:biopolymer transport protein ExbB